MSVIPVNLAVEDELSEAVLRRVLIQVKRGFAVGTAYRRGGFGYLRRTIRGWNNAAKGIPFVLLTDLDEYACPKALIEEWLDIPRHPNLVLRVAVREVEAWLLADRVNVASFLGVPVASIPQGVEALADPKAEIIERAGRSRFPEVRDRIAPKRGSTAQQGLDYNGCLAAFVEKRWSISAAARGAQSLARTLARLRSFTPLWQVTNGAPE